MTVYNMNRGIGWASSGVEYAQAYRAKLLRAAGVQAKFIFTDLFLSENIEHFTKNIGFEDEEVIWLYSYFTDFPTAPTTYTEQELTETFAHKVTGTKREDGSVIYFFGEADVYAKAYLKKDTTDIIQRVEYVSGGKLIRKDYFTCGRLFSEYYSPVDRQAHLYLRRFYNMDGTEAWTENIDGDRSIYRIGNTFLYSKERFIAYFMKCLNPGAEDVIIIDRATEIGRAVLQYHGRAKVGSVVHAEHYNESSLEKREILWNNFYEYEFTNADRLDFFIASTDAQNRLMREQFENYFHRSPRVETIPVGSLAELKYPEGDRKRHSMITASRLASEKHLDWLVMAAVKAHEEIPDISLDIYGSGGEEKKLKALIGALGAEEYIRLMGHRRLDEIYRQYEVYAAGSTSEGFGLTLLEAVGSGLAMIGFDVHYGNQTFIAPDENGYLLPYSTEESVEDHVRALAEAMVRMFRRPDTDDFSKKSYEIAEKYLTHHIVDKWKTLLESLNDQEEES